jgi:hypothetical protein
MDDPQLIDSIWEALSTAGSDKSGTPPDLWLSQMKPVPTTDWPIEQSTKSWEGLCGLVCTEG